MVIQAQLNDGTLLEFPDGTDDAIINATVKDMISGVEQKPPVEPDLPPVPTPPELDQPGPIPEGTTSALGLVERDFITDFKDSIAGRAIQSVPSSAAQTGRDLIAPILHPLDTAIAVKDLFKGIAGKTIPGLDFEEEKVVDAVADFYKKRYGGIANLKETIAEDPVGVLVDIGSILTAGGGALKGVSALSSSAKAAKVSQILTKVGAQIEPLTIVTKAAGQIGRKLIPAELPNKLFQSSAKFSTTLSEPERRALTRTALDNNITPNAKGIESLRTSINGLNDEITTLIDTATDSGKKIPVKRLFREFRKLNRESTLTGKPIANQRAINRIRKEVFQANERIGRKAFTPDEVQKLKQNIYKETESFYSTAKEAPATRKAQMAIARAAKESLEEIFPEIKQLNKKEGSLIQLRTQLEKSSARITNRDLLGIGVPIKGTAGGVVAGAPGIAAGMAIGLFDTPVVKAKLAIVLNKIQQKGIQLNPDSAFVRFGIAQAGRLERQPRE